VTAARRCGQLAIWPHSRLRVGSVDPGAAPRERREGGPRASGEKAGPATNPPAGVRVLAG
jgi:hypothetical protein